MTRRKITPPEERFWPKVKKTDTCWLWTASLRGKGYGEFWNGQRRVGAHRFAYELLVGPHPRRADAGPPLPRVRNCVNPAHLEPVTNRENILRGKEHKTHCVHGHEFTPENTYSSPSDPRRRLCRKCRRKRSREAKRNARERERCLRAW